MTDPHGKENIEPLALPLVPNYDLAALVRGITTENQPGPEADFGEPIGTEIW